MIDYKDDKTEYFDCVSDCEILRIAKIKWDDNPDYFIYELAIFSRAKRYGFIYRLKQIWQILRYGNAYNDNIIFEKEQFENFKRIINEF